MRKAMSSIALLLFASVIVTSFIAVFNGRVVDSNLHSSVLKYPSFLAY